MHAFIFRFIIIIRRGKRKKTKKQRNANLNKHDEVKTVNPHASCRRRCYEEPWDYISK